MKSALAFSLFVTLGLAQQNSNCGQTCIDNMLAKAEPLGCEPEDMECLCENMDFGFGVRDCTTEACPDADIEAIVERAEAMCPEGSDGPTGTTTSGPTASEPGDGTTNGPTQTATDGETTNGPEPTGTNTDGPNPTGGNGGGGDDDDDDGDDGDNTDGPSATGTGGNGGGNGGNGGNGGGDGDDSPTETDGGSGGSSPTGTDDEDGAPGETESPDAAPMVTAGPAIAGALGMMAILAV